MIQSLHVDSALQILFDASEAMARQLNHMVSNAAKDLQEGLDRQARYTQVIMTHLESFKEA